MFEITLDGARRNLDAVRHSIQTSALLRDLIANKGLQCGNLNSPCKGINEIYVAAPARTDWKVLDHCAAVTRTYAILEKFVRDVGTEWLSFLQSVKRYSELSEQLRENHRRGVGQVLSDITKRQFRHLNAKSVIADFHVALGDSGAYRVLPEALLAHEQNLRLDELARVLATCGLDGCREWAEAHRALRKFFSDSSRESGTVEAELRNLVESRNDAAHGTLGTNQVLGDDVLVEYVDFVEALAISIAELALTKAVEVGDDAGRTRKLGRITEHFTNAVVAIVEGATIKVGDTVILRGKNYCYRSIVESLQVNGANCPNVTVLNPTEVGFVFNPVSQKHSDIFPDIALPVLAASAKVTN